MHCFACCNSQPWPFLGIYFTCPFSKEPFMICQLEIITPFFNSSMVFVCTSFITSVLYSSILYWIISLVDFFFQFVLFLSHCLDSKDKNFGFLWISFSHGGTSKFFKLIYSIDLNSENILQILLYVWVLQFYSFGDNTYSKKLVWFVV